MIYNRMNRQTDRCMYARAVQTTESTKKKKKTTEIKKQQRTENECSINEQRCHWMKFSWYLVADGASAVFNSRDNNNNRKKIHCGRQTFWFWLIDWFSSNFNFNHRLFCPSKQDVHRNRSEIMWKRKRKKTKLQQPKNKVQVNFRWIFHSKILFCDTLCINPYKYII